MNEAIYYKNKMTSCHSNSFDRLYITFSADIRIRHHDETETIYTKKINFKYKRNPLESQYFYSSYTQLASVLFTKIELFILSSELIIISKNKNK